VPRPGAGEILVRVRAAAATPTELLWVPTWTTRAGEPRPFPIIPGHEFSGEVHGVGPGVNDVAVGEAVFGMNDWFGDGAQAEFCVARTVDVAPKPKSVDHVTAAVVPISALTAWQGLAERAKLARGERVLIHGAAGSVGLFAVQLARGIGAYVIATASEHNLEFARGLGADEVIDYRARPFEDAATGVDVVFDTVGGDTLARSWPILRPGGRMVTIAADAEHTSEQRVKDAFFIVEPNREQLSRIARMIDAGELRPVVGAAFPLAEARRAYAHKPVRGKVVLVVDGG
jgi:NADPH:quinone reductase-like Zn-dependent oxidoreductase